MKLLKINFVLLFTSLVTGCVLDDEVKYCADIEAIDGQQNRFALSTFEQNIAMGISGTPIAVSCHNCYENSEELNKTLALIESVIAGGTDFIELDVLFDAQSQQLTVSHDINSLPVDFESVIHSELLTHASQIMFIEVKGNAISKEQARELLRGISAPLNAFNEKAYLNDNRKTFIRSFEFNKGLSVFHEVIQEPEFSEIKPYLLLSRLTYKKSQEAMLAEIKQTAQCGLNMVEVSGEIEPSRLVPLVEYARSLGLLVSVFTFNETELQEKVAPLLPFVDVVTLEPNRESSVQTVFDKARQLIEL